MTAPNADTIARIDALLNTARANIAALDEAIRHIADLSRGYADGFNARVEHPVQQHLNAPETRAGNLAARRRAHVSGLPSKIDTDPELRAFIIARIATHTFTAIRDEIRVHFPPDRQTSLSSLSRWWQREGQFLPARSQDNG